MNPNFNFKKYLEDSVNAIYAEQETEKKQDKEINERNQPASYYLKKALEHLHEVDLYLSAATDGKSDISEEDIKTIRNINVYGSLSKIEKELKAIKQK